MPTKNSSLAFATHEGLRALGENDRLLANHFVQYGLTVEAVVWNDPNVDWDQFERVVIRSTWDYYHKVEDYKRWINNFKQRSTRLINPPDVVLTNLHKGYLLDLAQQGFNVIPSQLFKAGDLTQPDELIAHIPWQDFVVKPAIGASAFDVARLSKELTHNQRETVQTLMNRGDFIVQPFINEIRQLGEWSFIFIDHRFSHTVIKRPQRDDFRVQNRYGGHYQQAMPTKNLIKQAETFINAIDGRATYARVDAVEVSGELLLIELELNEPCLFFDENNPAAMLHFLEAIGNA